MNDSPITNIIPNPTKPTPIPAAARHFSVSPRTVGNWIASRYIVAYQRGSEVLVDLDQIEEAFKTNKHMRDGRRLPFGKDAIILPLAYRAEVVTETEAAGQ